MSEGVHFEKFCVHFLQNLMLTKPWKAARAWTTFLLRWPAPQMPNSPHSQVLKPSDILMNLNADIETHDFAFFLEWFNLFPPCIKGMTYFWRKAENNEKITIRFIETVTVTTDWWILPWYTVLSELDFHEIANAVILFRKQSWCN